MTITEMCQGLGMTRPRSTGKPPTRHATRAQVTVRGEFSQLLRTLFPALLPTSFQNRTLFGLIDPNAQFGEMPAVQAFLERLRIPYDLSWEEGECFDSGVRQIRYREVTQETIENWIFPWEGLISHEAATTQLAALSPLPEAPVTYLQQLAEESTSAHTLQALNHIPVSRRQRLIASVYPLYANILRYPWRTLRNRVLRPTMPKLHCVTNPHLVET